MSLIYDALKRAEDDNKRTVGTVRASGRRTLLGKRRQQWMWALVAVLGANVIVVTTLVVTLGYRSSGSRAPDTETRVDATPAPARAVPVEPPPVARPAPPPPPAPPRVARVEPVPAAKVTKPPAAPVESPRVVAPAAPPRPIAPVTPAPRVAPSPTAAPAPPVEPPRSGIRTPESSGRPPITGEKAPTPENKSAAGARPVPPPAIALQVLVYSDVPAQRMVFIDGRRLAEGDSIDAETTLERIDPDGIVIRRRGVRYVVLSHRD